MSTYVLMRILESAPRRYDWGIRLLTFGRLDRAYERLLKRILPGQRVLDIGCGTGALTLRSAAREASVKAIDINPQMLEIARDHLAQAGLSDAVDLAEMGVAELDGESAAHYDAITAGLCLSELSGDELSYALSQAMRLLKPGGLLLIADEIRPEKFLLRCVYQLIRVPLVALTWMLTQQTTRPLADLTEALAVAGFELISTQRSALGNFGEFVAQRPAGAPR